MIGNIITAEQAPGLPCGYCVVFDCLGYYDYRDTIKPWVDENLTYGALFLIDSGASVLLFDPGDYALFMLRWA